MKVVSGVEELDNFILDNINNNRVTLLYFGAMWCGPCKQLKDKLKDSETLRMMPRLEVGYLDVDDTNNEELKKRYKVQSLPTQIFIQVHNNMVKGVRRIDGYDFTKLKMEYEYCAQI
jgi:thiol-disulfide isomerase/thioredoxin